MSGQSEAQNELQRILQAAGLVPGDCPALIAALERDRVVGVLDAWADDVGGEWKAQTTATVYRCSCDVGSDRKGWDCHALTTGATPAEARAKAAAAIEAAEV